MKFALPMPRSNRWTNGPSGPNRAALTQLVKSAAAQLFDTLSMGVTYTGTFPIKDSRWHQPISILPFTGQQMAGSLLLVAPLDLMGQTSPTGEQDFAALTDWSRELANLLAGSLKTALMRQGIIIELGIPASLFGGDVRIALPAETGLGLLFESGDNALHVVLDAYLAADLEIRSQEDNGASFAVLLF